MKALLPLCSIPKMAMRDGMVGATARIFLPFYQYGYWFASGQQFTFQGGTIGQDMSMTMGGTKKSDIFIKAPGICLN